MVGRLPGLEVMLLIRIWLPALVAKDFGQKLYFCRWSVDWKIKRRAPCETCEFSFICSYWGLLPRRWPVRHLWGTVWKRWCRDRFFICMDLVQRVLASHTSQQKTDDNYEEQISLLVTILLSSYEKVKEITFIKFSPENI